MRSFQTASSARAPTALISPRRATAPVKLPAQHILSPRTHSPSPPVSLRSSLEVLGHGKTVGASQLLLPDCAVDQGARSGSSCSCPCSPSGSLCRNQLSPDLWSARTPSTCASSTCQSMYTKMKEDFASECQSMQAKMQEEMSSLSQRVDKVMRYFATMEQILGTDALDSGIKRDRLKQQLREQRNRKDHPPACDLEAGDPVVLQQLIDDSVRWGINATEIQCAREKLRDLEEFTKKSASGSTDIIDIAHLNDICRDAQQYPVLDLDQPEEGSTCVIATVMDVCTAAWQEPSDRGVDVGDTSLEAPQELDAQVQHLRTDHVLRDITNCDSSHPACGMASCTSPGLGAKRIDSGGISSPLVPSHCVFKEPFTFSESGLLDDVSLRATRSPFHREECEALSSASPHRWQQEADTGAVDVVLDLSDVLDEVHQGSMLGNSLDESMIGAGIDESFDGSPPAIARPQPSPSTIFFPAPPVNVSPLAIHAGDSQIAQSSVIST